MRAIILAGGKGQRLRPYTYVLPKPLMPVGERPVLEIVVRQLKEHGFDRITFAVGYLAELTEAYFRDGARFGVSIDYSLEEIPLGTAGPLSLIEAPTDDFLVMNGDILTNLDYSAFLRAHRETNSIATLAVYKKSVPISLGVLDLDDRNNIVKYTEKPTSYFLVSTGIYCFRPDIVKYLEKNVRLDLPDLITRLIAEGETVHAHQFEGFWLDIGRHEDYEIAQEEYAKGSF